MNQTHYNGILCMDKPPDFTSFDVVKKLRGMTKTKKLGHAGTLDPMATGVLPVFFGVATKACDLLPDSDKRYAVTFTLGKTSDTQDIWGTMLTQQKSAVTLPQLEEALTHFRGEIEQLPPMYSAVQINGQRLYDLARKGIEVERTPRPVTIYECSLMDFDEEKQEGRAVISCSKGTYIRTICHDLGQMLGVGAVMTALRRVEAAGFGLHDCLSFEEVAALLEAGTLESRMLPIEQAFSEFPKVFLNEIQTRMFLNGVRLDLNRVRCKDIVGRCRVYGEDKSFLGLADCDRETLELKLVKFFIERG